MSLTEEMVQASNKNISSGESDSDIVCHAAVDDDNFDNQSYSSKNRKRRNGKFIFIFIL